ncbi:DUF4260 family protein [Devosia sp. SL43]|uniref:DUF4260 family protein n=1 Tax=Devosia sp. SL43 TaxID=2806348 RepID=UPI001F2F7CFB|nr:DUF4260 family protein [Devosia sp. SL43]UJW84513.1 DUF4260 family protein [Devosia sp. SL43]
MTEQPASSTTEPVTGNAVLLQRLEGGAIAVLGLVAYTWLGQSWWVFALLLLLPDLSMLGYLRGGTTGMLTYNLVHTYVAPALLALLGLVVGPIAFGLAAIWTVHIGLDRLLGYGLKHADGFEHTHLGLIGKARRGR